MIVSRAFRRRIARARNAAAFWLLLPLHLAACAGLMAGVFIVAAIVTAATVVADNFLALIGGRNEIDGRDRKAG